MVIRWQMVFLTLLWILSVAAGAPAGPPPPAATARSPIPKVLQEGVGVGEFYSVAVTPDGRYIAAGVRRSAPVGVKEEKAVDIFDARTGKPIGFYVLPRPYEGIPKALAFSGDGALLVIGGQDGKVFLWDTGKGAHLRTLTLPAPVESVALSKDGQWLAVGARDGGLRLWQRGKGGWSQPVLRLTRIILKGDDLRPVERLPEPQRLMKFLDPLIFRKPPFVRSVVFDPKGTWLAVTGTGDLNADTVKEGIAILRLPDGRVQGVLSGHGKGVALKVAGRPPVPWVNALAVSRDGRWLASAGWDATVRVWDMTKRAEVRRLLSPRTPLGAFATRVYNAVAISPDSRLVAAGGFGGRVDVWNLSTGTLVRSLETGNIVEAVAFTPDGVLLIAGGWDGRLTAWRVGSWQRSWSRSATGRTSERTNPPPLL
ncbi:MAG: hypothetical protein NZ959_06635 [Armatimonadetes bacterium]|nr:hypothetical protein [Armatimonadota bacterium]MDW8121149.1 hypothetical protein [Armatimonadota bacterium]